MLIGQYEFHLSLLITVCTGHPLHLNLDVSYGLTMKASPQCEEGHTKRRCKSFMFVCLWSLSVWVTATLSELDEGWSSCQAKIRRPYMARGQSALSVSGEHSHYRHGTV